MENNRYITDIKNYVEKNTPVKIEFDEHKYELIAEKLTEEKINSGDKEILKAVYCLFYSALNLHKEASICNDCQPYNILLGDYISSYIAELLYRKHMLIMLKIFAVNTKRIMLSQLNNQEEDHLLKEMLEALK